jgi:hypothetical protein
VKKIEGTAAHAPVRRDIATGVRSITARRHLTPCDNTDYAVGLLGQPRSKPSLARQDVNLRKGPFHKFV